MNDTWSPRALLPTTTDKRRKLWEIDHRLHCSIVGTCLTLRDLRKIAKQLNLAIPDDMEEYDVHGRFVGAAYEPRAIAKAMQKMLERKHQIAVRQFGRATTDQDVNELWTRCLAQGDVPGPYWALMSHPATSRSLMTKAFGHVHMLSHLVGASNRADIRRLNALEAEKSSLADQLDNAKRQLAERDAEMRDLLAQHADEVGRLNERLFRARAAEERLAAVEDRLANFETGGEYATLWRTSTDLKRQLAEQTERAEQIEARRALLEFDLQRLQASNKQLGKALQDAVSEREALDDVLRSRLFVPRDLEGESRTARQSPDLDLGGRRIVYVGGRSGAVGHLKTLVERANGTLIHHDGGVETTSLRLTEVLAQGDAVLCPVDCVSHDACQRAKQFCKRNAKTFIPLRSSGISSFVIGLQEVVSAQGHRT